MSFLSASEKNEFASAIYPADNDYTFFSGAMFDCLDGKNIVRPNRDITDEQLYSLVERRITELGGRRPNFAKNRNDSMIFKRPRKEKHSDLEVFSGDEDAGFQEAF